MQRNEPGSRIRWRLGTLVMALCAFVAAVLLAAPAPALAVNQQKTVDIPVTFTVTGTTAKPTFTAKLEKIDNDAPMPAEGGEVIASEGAGTVYFGTITYNAPGIYHYKITQTTEAMNNWVLDTTTYYVVVQVAWNDAGTDLTATVIAYKNADYTGDKVTKFEFINKYITPVTPPTPEPEPKPDPTPDPTPEPTTPATFTFTGTKTLEGAMLKAGEFTFEVRQGDALTATGTVKADGTIEFTQMEFSQVGTYEFTVTEVQGTEEGITYDDASFKVVIVVTQDADGNLVATLDQAASDTIAFVNKYTASTPTNPSEPSTPKIVAAGDVTQWGPAVVLLCCGVAAVGVAVGLRRRKDAK